MHRQTKNLPDKGEGRRCKRVQLCDHFQVVMNMRIYYEKEGSCQIFTCR